MSPRANPIVTQSKLTAMTKNLRSMRLRLFHQGTCWISMSMARSAATAAVDEEEDELEEDGDSGLAAAAVVAAAAAPLPDAGVKCGVIRAESDLR